MFLDILNFEFFQIFSHNFKNLVKIVYRIIQCTYLYNVHEFPYIKRFKKCLKEYRIPTFSLQERKITLASWGLEYNIQLQCTFHGGRHLFWKLQYIFFIIEKKEALALYTFRFHLQKTLTLLFSLVVLPDILNSIFTSLRNSEQTVTAGEEVASI